MPTIEVRAKLVKETKNKLRYAETDDNGDVVDIRAAKVGTMYYPKDIFDGEKPEMIKIKVEVTAL